MANLRSSLERDGSFEGVKTWLQSGNVMFQTSNRKLSLDEINSKIRRILRDDFDLTDVPIMIRTAQEIQQTVSSNPFAPSDQYEMKRIFVAFLNEIPSPKLLAAFNEIDYSPEEYVVNHDLQAIYFYIPDFAKYKLDTTLFEKKLGIKATSRNWKTINKLAEITATSSKNTDDCNNDKKKAAATTKITTKKRKKGTNQPALSSSSNTTTAKSTTTTKNQPANPQRQQQQPRILRRSKRKRSS